MAAHHEPPANFRTVIQAMGLVFGDIGTSPIYTFAAVLMAAEPTPENALGVLSLIIWTLLTIVTVQYGWLAMSLSDRGEGGPLVLRERLGQFLKKGRHAAWCTLLLHLGISLMIGDGVITPAISILSAVEGIQLVPGWEQTPRWALIAIAIALTFVLFMIQKRGAGKISNWFGPIMVVWFIALFFSGLQYLDQWPAVWKAFNPWRGLSFLFDHGVAGFFILSQVILCATGGEALYSDIGHIGRRPIRVAWIFVFVACAINYLGQGAFLQSTAARTNILFAMFQAWQPELYTPFLILTCVATVIASQSVISGVFSVIYQVVNARVFPPLKVDYTSSELRTQVYLPVVNWMLFGAVLAVLIFFQASANLAAAYGMAVIGTMTITGLFLTSIYIASRAPIKAAIAAVLLCIDASFLFSCLFKIPEGGWVSLLIALLPFALMRLYHHGQVALGAKFQGLSMQQFAKVFEHAYQSQPHLHGCACWCIRSMDQAPAYLLLATVVNRILYHENVLCHVERSTLAYGVTAQEHAGPCKGMRTLTITAGYRERLELDEVFKAHGYRFDAVFYGAEDIHSPKLIWRLFGLVKRLSSSWARFYRLPEQKSHGVIVQMELGR
jgi:KUP system potassium uptake protein